MGRKNNSVGKNGYSHEVSSVRKKMLGSIDFARRGLQL